MGLVTCRAAAPRMLRVVSVVCLLALFATGVHGTIDTAKCASSCGEQLTGLGYSKAVNDSLACTRTTPRGTLTRSCCNKVADLFTKGGHLSECLCCRQFADAFVSKLPLSRLNLTREGLFKQWAACDAPVYSVKGGKESCPLLRETDFFRGSAFPPGNLPRPRVDTANLTADNLLEYIGFNPELRPDRLEARGAALIRNGTKQLQVVGADNKYNNYITAYVDWIERRLPKYKVGKYPALPPLPSRFKADVDWVKGLRRGAYPSVILLKPEDITMPRADPLQNGSIARLPPGQAFQGRLPRLPL